MKENNKRSIEPIKIGNFISKCRKEKGLTQEDLAVKFGITSQSVSKWENGLSFPKWHNKKNYKICFILKGKSTLMILS